MTEAKDSRQKESSHQQMTPPPRLLHTAELFQGDREVCLEHDGKRYRLRITRRNKLILQK